MTFKRFCFFLSCGLFFPLPRQLFMGLGRESPSPPPTPQLVKDCVWRVREQCTKVKECKNSSTRGPARGRGLSAEASSGLFFPAPRSDARGGAQVQGQQSESQGHRRWQLTRGSGFSIEGASAAFPLLPTHCLIPDNFTPIYRRGDRGSQWMKCQPHHTQPGGESWDLASGPSESRR